MKNRILNIATLVVVGGALGVAVAFMGCSKTFKQCAVSPIDIEEVHADTRDLDAELAGLMAQQNAVETELADWESQVAERRAQIPDLRANLDNLKKSSGVTEKIDETAGAQATTTSTSP